MPALLRHCAVIVDPVGPAALYWKIIVPAELPFGVWNVVLLFVFAAAVWKGSLSTEARRAPARFGGCGEKLPE